MSSERRSGCTTTRFDFVGRILRLFPLALLALVCAGQAQAQSSRERLVEFQNTRVPALDDAWVITQFRAVREGLPLRVELANGEIASIQGFMGDRPVYYIADNVNAADTVSTDEVHPGGAAGLLLDGTGETLGIWDGGSVRNTHQELTPRVTNNDAASFSPHATHVAGTMIAGGVSPSALGMAFAANIRAWDFNSDISEMITEQLSSDPVLVSTVAKSWHQVY